MGLLIGEVARRCGLSTSALRYYERAGLLPPPARVSKRRVYELRVLGRLEDCEKSMTPSPRAAQ